MAFEAPIGIFDSGIGGLTVFREIEKILPNENLTYLGDTARVPYGTKSKQTVERFARECVRFLHKKGIKMVVVACNTASAFALEVLKGEFSFPVLGVIEPGAKGALKSTKKKKIGVIGTEGTIRSDAYALAVKRLEPQVEVSSVACPLFVPLVEEGWTQGEIPEKTAGHYLKSFKNSGIDTLILGCTHYPLLKPVLASLLPGVVLIDSAEQTSLEVEALLTSKKLRSTSREQGRNEFYVTDSVERFRRVGEIFMGGPLPNVTQVEI